MSSLHRSHPGIKVLVHDTPENRGTWQVHGKLGFYIGRALLHYRCHKVYMADSRATRISDCLDWFPVAVKMPVSSPLEELTAAVEAAVEAVKRILATLATDADPTGRHPLQEAASTGGSLYRRQKLFWLPNYARYASFFNQIHPLHTRR